MCVYMHYASVISRKILIGIYRLIFAQCVAAAGAFEILEEEDANQRVNQTQEDFLSPQSAEPSLKVHFTLHSSEKFVSFYFDEVFYL